MSPSRSGSCAALAVLALSLACGGAGAPDAPASAPRDAASAATPLEAALRRLHTHRELRAELALLELLSRGRVRAGPLVRNGANGGLVDVDGPVAHVLPAAAGICGPQARPSIREAVACTVAEGPGNSDPARIGFTTQGRELLAARVGNPRGLRVVVLTQQHGNEVASTEAALELLRELAFSEAPWVRRALRSLDLLFVLRVNADGGEPRTSCAIGPFDVGATFPQDCALTRYDVDPRAGVPLAGSASSEDGFFGIVGQGYDLNRYHFGALDGPIRPVETQAVAAVMLALRPDTLLDLHGDVVKTTCAVDPASVVVDPTLGLPLALRCERAPGAAGEPFVGPSPADELVSFSAAAFSYADPADPRRLRSRALFARAAREVNALGLGPSARLTQLALGSGVLRGDIDGYMGLGVTPLTAEVRSFSPTAVALAVQAIRDGQPEIGFVTDWPFDPAFLRSGIEIDRTILRSALRTLTAFAAAEPANDGDFCALPTATGAVFTLPERFFGPNPFANSPIVLPFGLVPIQTQDDCPAAAR